MAEVTQGKTMAKAGLYRHKETGEELVAVATEKFGNPQADAFMRLGFEYVGEAKGADKEAALAIPDPHAAPLATPQGVKSVAELESELAAAKLREAEAEERRKEADKVNAVAENSVADSNPAKAQSGTEVAEKKGKK